MTNRAWLAAAVLSLLLAAGIACEREQPQTISTSTRPTTSPAGRPPDAGGSGAAVVRRQRSVSEQVKETPQVRFIEEHAPEISKYMEEGRPDLAMQRLDEIQKGPYGKEAGAVRVMESMRETIRKRLAASQPATGPATGPATSSAGR
jgi:hypothetical protein